MPDEQTDDMPPMRIYVDADAVPRDIKDLLFRAATRTKIPVTFIANQYMQLPESELFDMIQVAAGPDVADERIVDLVNAGDLVITADIPLAAAVVDKGAQGLSPRGDLFTDRNIGQRLAMRDLMTDLRNNDGIETGGPPPLNQKDCHAFANELDRFLARRLKQKRPTP